MKTHPHQGLGRSLLSSCASALALALLLAGHLAPVNVLAQQPRLIGKLSPEGQLKWDDVSSAFVQATSYTVECAPCAGGTQPVWTALATVPATNGSYTLEVPMSSAGMLYRLRANVQGRFPRLKIAVVSDAHYFAPSLLIKDGPAFQSYLANDPKLLVQSQAILEEVIAELKLAKPDIVLLPGDLTKDGEMVCHEAMTNYLYQLKAAGAKVFVCPGNHDILNSDSKAYNGTQTTPVLTVLAKQFAEMYTDFGYGDALARDPGSLSYVSEPVPGLWILSMDACHPHLTGGSFSAAELGWITNQLAAARAQGKLVLGMMHHGILEHFLGQKAMFSDFVLDNYRAVAQRFAGYGMEVVFTGHFHAQDIVQTNFDSGTLLDIETGSLVTFPCAYRLLTLETNGNLAIASHPVTHIDFDLGGVSFPTYASNFVRAGLISTMIYIATHSPYNLSSSRAQVVAPALAEAAVALYQGDEAEEALSPETQSIIAQLRSASDVGSRRLVNTLNTWLHDPAPADNALTLNLITGKVVSTPAAVVAGQGRSLTR